MTLTSKMMLPGRLALVLSFCYTTFASAHMAFIIPRARQVVMGVGLIQHSYTTFGSFGDVYGNNANIFGGPSGESDILTQGYELCGDDARRKAFTIPSSYGYAPTDPQMTITSGTTFEVMVRVTAHHYGWFEFRLCAPSAGQKVVTEETVSCFKQHLLQLAPDQYYTQADMMTGIRSVFDFEGTPEAGYNFHHAKCQKGPPDTCCDPNSGCSPENANVHRFMLPRPGVDNNEFRIKLLAPADVTCDRCTIQITYRTGNSPDSYPETFWNCADVALVAPGQSVSTKSPTPPTPAPTWPVQTRPPSSTTATKAPISTPAPTTSRAPTARLPGGTRYPTARPTSLRPTTLAPVTVRCGVTWEQCGGQSFSGGKCCASSADTCQYQNPYYSQCVPKASIASTPPTTPTKAPTSAPTTAGCKQTWEQCGGNGYVGNTCCTSAGDACTYVNDWWSACQPKTG